MKKILLLYFAFLTSHILSAHPGVGIVKDSKGNIYYTDLKQIWKITPDEKKIIVVPNVHSHELYIDAEDNLYGEHVWYNGERLDTWGHHVWSLRNDGSIIKIKEPTEGFLTGYSFNRDDKGNMYWVERWTISRFKRKTPEGKITTIAEGRFKDIRWMHTSKDGIVYFLDLDKLYSIHNSQVKLLADNLNEQTASFAWTGDRHNAYGIWTDASDNVYVALHGGQRVKKITPAGNVSTYLHSTSPWSPTSGVFDNAGDLWLLEYTITADCRVRKIGRQTLMHSGTTKAFLINNGLPALIVSGIAVAIIAGVKKFLQRSAKLFDSSFPK